MRYRIIGAELLGGAYLFHAHTKTSDGQLTHLDYLEWARNFGVGVVFLEHIRRVASYDAQGFLREVRYAAEQAGVPCKVGFEAKVLSDGSLDIEPCLLESCDVIGIAEHGYVTDISEVKAALYQAFERYAHLTRKITLVWVHPGLWMKKAGLLVSHVSDYKKMVEFAVSTGILVERNLRYHLAPGTLVDPRVRSSTVLGADAHSARDLVRWLRAVTR